MTLKRDIDIVRIQAFCTDNESSEATEKNMSVWVEYLLLEWYVGPQNETSLELVTGTVPVLIDPYSTLAYVILSVAENTNEHQNYELCHLKSTHQSVNL